MSYSLLEFALLGGAALAGGAVNALAGGGTLLTFPALLGVGVPALAANVTNTVALSPGYISGAYTQRDDLRGQRRRAAAVALPALVGGIAGSLLLLGTGEKLFSQLVPWLILVAAVLIGADPWLKRWAKNRIATHAEASGGHLAVTGAAAFVGAVYGGFFGAGLGIILLALFSVVVRENLIRINALKQLTSSVANLAAAAFLVFSGYVEWQVVPVMAVGAIVGAAAASKWVRGVDPQVLRAAVVVISVCVAVAYFIKQ